MYVLGHCGACLNRLTSVLILVVGLLFFPATSAPLVHAQSSGDPLVLALYYPWFDENAWTFDRLSDLPAEPYSSRDRGVMGRHIEQAKAAGIDAFLVAWYGPGGESNQTEPNLAALLEEAAVRNFRIGILFETDSPFMGGVGAITAGLQHALSRHASQAAYLRADGRPVIFFWRPTLYGLDTWRAIRSQVDAGNSSLWVAEGVNTGYLAVFDGHYLYSNTWNPPTDLSYTNQKFARLVASASQQFQTNKLWVATVMPGYNDVRIRPGSGFVKDREGGAYYARSWQAAIVSKPNWVVVTSFNEWPEGTYIEPSQTYDNQYLNLTATWSQQFKAGGGASVAPAGAPIVAAAPAPAPTLDPNTPTAVVQVDLLNLRGGPGTTFPILGMVPLNTTLLVIGRQPTFPDWWQVRHGGQVAWVYAPMVTASGPLERVAVVQ
jgi:hypothetical protein